MSRLRLSYTRTSGFKHLLTVICLLPHPLWASSNMDMMDALDKLDKLDLRELVADADKCTKRRNYDCAEAKLAAAAKLSRDDQDRKSIAEARASLGKEREIERREILARQEEERRQKEQERIAQIRAQEAEANSGSNFGAALFAAAVAGVDKYNAVKAANDISRIPLPIAKNVPTFGKDGKQSNPSGSTRSVTSNISGNTATTAKKPASSELASASSSTNSAANNAQATQVLQAEVAKDVNALGAPYRMISIAISCRNTYGSYDGSEQIADGPCAQQERQAKAVQCRSDWMTHPATLRMYECAVANSTGSFRNYYQTQMQWVSSQINQYGPAKDEPPREGQVDHAPTMVDSNRSSRQVQNHCIGGTSEGKCGIAK